jgi:hypothetical protein
VFAIKTDDGRSQQLVKRELIDQCAVELAHSGLQDIFHVIQFNQSLSEKILKPQDADTYLTRSRGHLIIYGDLVKGKIDATDTYIMRLNGLVKHRPIPVELSKQFSGEFGAVLLREVSFPESTEMLGFKFTRQSTALMIKYIVGISVGMAGNLLLAKELFSHLEQEVGAISSDETNPLFERLLSGTKQRIIEVLQTILRVQYFGYTATRDKNFLLNCEPLAFELEGRAALDLHSVIMKAMIHFFRGNINEAIMLLDKNKHPDASRLFCLGFLHAYLNENEKAQEYYKSAFRGVTSTNVVNDTELFISDVLAESPERKQLLFYRGLINFKGKQDFELAKEDFESFLGHSDTRDFPELHRLATMYLGKCESEIAVARKFKPTHVVVN